MTSSSPQPHRWSWLLAAASAILFPIPASAYESPSEIRISTFDEEGSLQSRSLEDFKGKIVALYYFTPW